MQSPPGQEANGLHERLYQAATSLPIRRKVGSEEFMKDITEYEVKVDNPTIH